MVNPFTPLRLSVYVAYKHIIRVVTLHAAVIASGPLTYLIGCGIASYYFKLSGQKRVQIMDINNSVDASLLRYFIIERYEDII